QGEGERDLTRPSASQEAKESLSFWPPRPPQSGKSRRGVQERLCQQRAEPPQSERPLATTSNQRSSRGLTARHAGPKSKSYGAISNCKSASPCARESHQVVTVKYGRTFIRVVKPTLPARGATAVSLAAGVRQAGASLSGGVAAATLLCLQSWSARKQMRRQLPLYAVSHVAPDLRTLAATWLTGGSCTEKGCAGRPQPCCCESSAAWNVSASVTYLWGQTCTRGRRRGQAQRCHNPG
ncbi:unnamed protein product, partial [Effrenium voratum]